MITRGHVSIPAVAAWIDVEPKQGMARLIDASVNSATVMAMLIDREMRDNKQDSLFICLSFLFSLFFVFVLASEWVSECVCVCVCVGVGVLFAFDCFSLSNIHLAGQKTQCRDNVAATPSLCKLLSVCSRFCSSVTEQHNACLHSIQVLVSIGWQPQQVDFSISASTPTAIESTNKPNWRPTFKRRSSLSSFIHIEINVASSRFHLFLPPPNPSNRDDCMLHMRQHAATNNYRVDW